jgi:gas vesicle protein
MHEDESGGYWRGLVTGVLIGAGVALLLAPRRGQELREGILESAGNLKERGADAVETAALAAMVKADEVRDAITHRGEAGSENSSEDDTSDEDDALEGTLDDAEAIAAEVGADATESGDEDAADAKDV